MAEDGDLHVKLPHTVQLGRKSWKSVFNNQLQGQAYKIVVRPAMMYDAETWAEKKTREEVECGKDVNVKMNVWSHKLETK